MISTVALATTCVILLVALAWDCLVPSRTAEAVAEWAEDGGYSIVELQRCPRPTDFRFGLCSMAQQLYIVDVVCNSGRPSRFVLKAGGYFWGNRVKKLTAYRANDALQAERAFGSESII